MRTDNMKGKSIKELEQQELAAIDTGKILLSKYKAEREKLDTILSELNDAKQAVLTARDHFSANPATIGELEHCEAGAKRLIRVSELQQRLYTKWLLANEDKFSNVRWNISKAIRDRYAFTRPETQQEIANAFRSAVNSAFPPASKRRIAAVLGFEDEGGEYKDAIDALRNALMILEVDAPEPTPHGIEDPAELPDSEVTKEALDEVIAKARDCQKSLAA